MQKRSKVTRKLTPESTVGHFVHRSISVSPRSINPLLFRSSKQLFGPCHSCGRYGHYWRTYPTRISTAAVANTTRRRSNSNNVSSVSYRAGSGLQIWQISLLPIHVHTIVIILVKVIMVCVVD